MIKIIRGDKPGVVSASSMKIGDTAIIVQEGYGNDLILRLEGKTVSLSDLNRTWTPGPTFKVRLVDIDILVKEID